MTPKRQRGQVPEEARTQAALADTCTASYLVTQIMSRMVRNRITCVNAADLVPEDDPRVAPIVQDLLSGPHVQRYLPDDAARRRVALEVARGLGCVLPECGLTWDALKNSESRVGGLDGARNIYQAAFLYAGAMRIHAVLPVFLPAKATATEPAITPSTQLELMQMFAAGPEHEYAEMIETYVKPFQTFCEQLYDPELLKDEIIEHFDPDLMHFMNDISNVLWGYDITMEEATL